MSNEKKTTSKKKPACRPRPFIAGISQGSPLSQPGGVPNGCPTTYNAKYRFYAVGSVTSFEIMALSSNNFVNVTVSGSPYLVSVDVFRGVQRKACGIGLASPTGIGLSTPYFDVVQGSTYRVTAYLNLPVGTPLPPNGSLTLSTNSHASGILYP